MRSVWGGWLQYVGTSNNAISSNHVNNLEKKFFNLEVKSFEFVVLNFKIEIKNNKSG